MLLKRNKITLHTHMYVSPIKCHFVTFIDKYMKYKEKEGDKRGDNRVTKG